MSLKLILGLVAIFIVGFGIWLMYWPLVECWYAMSLSPLTEWKIFSAVLGFFLVLGGGVMGIKTVI